MSLDKVLRLAQPAAYAPPDASELVRLASEDLERIALLLAQADDDEDDGDPDDEDEDDGDDSKGSQADAKAKGGKNKKPMPGKGDGKKVPPWLAKKQKVKASRELVLEAMVALSHLTGGETLSLSVLTEDERKKSSAHTIPGSTDYPIPDKGHLSAAVARYKQGKLAGHSKSEVAAHIRKHAKRLGEQVDLGDSGGDDDKVKASAVLALARGGQDVAMEHGPMSGEHEHPHRVVQVHSHKHTHNGDSRHACGEPYPGSIY